MPELGKEVFVVSVTSRCTRYSPGPLLVKYVVTSTRPVGIVELAVTIEVPGKLLGIAVDGVAGISAGFVLSLIGVDRQRRIQEQRAAIQTEHIRPPASARGAIGGVVMSTVTVVVAVVPALSVTRSPTG